VLALPAGVPQQQLPTPAATPSHGPSAKHSVKFTSINDYRSSNEAQGRTLHCLDDDEHGVPRTDVQQKAAVEMLMDAILDFGNWPNQVPIDNPRAVEAICNSGQFQPEEKILRILGATTTVTIEKIEILTWALLVSFY
jgi:hypothetical protein